MSYPLLRHARVAWLLALLAAGCGGKTDVTDTAEVATKAPPADAAPAPAPSSEPAPSEPAPAPAEAKP